VAVFELWKLKIFSKINLYPPVGTQKNNLESKCLNDFPHTLPENG
jgi:hypothetical protein